MQTVPLVTYIGWQAPIIDRERDSGRPEGRLTGYRVQLHPCVGQKDLEFAGERLREVGKRTLLFLAHDLLDLRGNLGPESAEPVGEDLRMTTRAFEDLPQKGPLPILSLLTDICDRRYEDEVEAPG